MKAIGTILPNAETFKLSEKFAEQQAAKKEKIAKSSKDLAECEKRSVGGEVRYYQNSNRYAIVNRRGDVTWFKVTKDGDFRD